MKVFNAFGNTYRGTLNKAMVAGDWKGRNYLRTFVKPKNPKTPRQLEQREFYETAVARWAAYVTLQKQAYAHKAKFDKRNLSGYNTSISSYMKARLAGETSQAPKAGNINILEVITGNPIEGAKVAIHRHDGVTVYAETYSTASGIASDGLCAEDENYDLFVTAVGYEDYADYDLASADIYGVLPDIELTPIP